jgi:hypothetical protein
MVLVLTAVLKERLWSPLRENYERFHLKRGPGQAAPEQTAKLRLRTERPLVCGFVRDSAGVCDRLPFGRDQELQLGIWFSKETGPLSGCVRELGPPQP